MGVIIMGGAFRGRKLATDTRAQVIRPTSGKVREALFSSLGTRVLGSRFVDLCAGSGAVGLEALSRGADEVFLVESHPQSLVLLKANIHSVTGENAAASQVRLVRSDASAFCRARSQAGQTFDLLFADPPFASDFSELPKRMGEILSGEGLAIIQFPSRAPPVWLSQADKVRKYGESSLAFFAAPSSK